MNLPIIIESPNFEFAIVGPTGQNEGVILKSKNSKNELIGYANLVYSGLNVNSDRIAFNNTMKYHNSWSEYISFFFAKNEMNVENRQFKTLLVWSENTSYSNIKEGMTNVFNRAIFDIYKLAFDKNLNDDTKKNNIEWLVSPLIFLGSQSTR